VTEGVFRKSLLPSGITLLTERVDARRSVSLGVWLRCGSRDEPARQLGITHFIEHMMFKGTERRDARAIAQSLESLGGHLDAFTTREQVCYYARSLSDNLSDVVDVLSDIVCRSRMTESDIAREKGVVREEILACEDDPEEKIGDLLAERMWGDHPLGRPILGTEQTVDSFAPDHLHSYFRHRFRPEDIVISAAGGLEHDALAQMVNQHFTLSGGEPLPLDGAPLPFVPSVFHLDRDLQQLHLSLGARGVQDGHEHRYPLTVLNILLGGGMSSRLFQSVREEAGLAYSVYSVQDVFRDCGMLSIHMAVSPERGREALGRTRDELRTLVAEGPSEEEVESAKSQYRGTVLMEHESVSSRMVHLAHEEIYRRSYTPPEELVRRVLAVTREQVAEMARQYLPPERFALVALGPKVEGGIREADWR
jgi:predicted Zn-dependent peptidase